MISDGGGTGGALTKVGTGTLTVTGINTYTGASTINGGTLEVDGSIASSSGVTVNSGGTLSGTGIAGPTTIMSGGTLAPGNPANPTGTLNISGNLAFQSGALYVVQVTPIAASSTSVSGTATLTGGTVNAQFAAGSYMSRQYIIVSAAGGLGGTTFANLTNTHLPAGFSDSLSYNGNKVYLNLTAVLGGGSDPSSLSGPHQNVATSLNNFFNGGGTLPANFVNVFGLTGGALTTALSQLNGEVATGAERSSFQLTNEFLSLMPDPFVNGRGYVGGAGFGGPSSAMPGCASGEQTSVSADAAIFRLSPPAAKDCGLRGVYEPRWSAWGSAFGGSTSANGNTAAGSNNITANTFGFAGGMDYRDAEHVVRLRARRRRHQLGTRQLARHRTRRRVRGRHLRHQLVRASLCGRCALFHQQLVHDQSLGARRPAQREFLGANFRRARRRRLSLRRAADARGDAIWRRAVPRFLHASLQRE